MTDQQIYEIREAHFMLQAATNEFYSSLTAYERERARARVRTARAEVQRILTRNNGLLANEQRAYRMGNITRMVSLGLIPVGVLATVGAILTGATGVGAELITLLGIAGAGGGFVAQRFYCTRERQAEMQRRIEAREREMQLAQDMLDRTASI